MSRDQGKYKKQDKQKAHASRVRHNHPTRDIKEFGQCPACDLYHMGVKRREQP